MSDVSGNNISSNKVDNFEAKRIKKTREPDFYKKYCKKWYENNKDYHNRYCREKIECECGKVVCRAGMINHKKTERHRLIMSVKNNNPN